MKKAFAVLVAVVLVLYALNLGVTHSLLALLKNAFYPVFVGVFFALLLNAPVTVLEQTLLRSPKIAKFKRLLSLFITLLVGAGFIALIGFLAIPELSESLGRVSEGLSSYLSGGSNFDKDTVVGKALSALIDKGEELLRAILPDLTAFLKSAVSSALKILLGLMLGILMLTRKEKLAEFGSKICVSLLGEKKTEFVKGALSVAVNKFSLFLGGQCVEAAIFGVACYVTFLCFGVPYALLAAVVAAVCNLVPTLGGYLGAAVGFLIIFPAAPNKAWLFLLLITVLQQIEQFTTYPVIVGRYVGLSNFSVLLAVVLGGGLFGFWGLLLGVPITAFAFNLINVLVARKNATEPLAEDNPPQKPPSEPEGEPMPKPPAESAE